MLIFPTVLLGNNGSPLFHPRLKQAIVDFLTIPREIHLRREITWCCVVRGISVYRGKLEVPFERIVEEEMGRGRDVESDDRNGISLVYRETP